MTLLAALLQVPGQMQPAPPPQPPPPPFPLLTLAPRLGLSQEQIAAIHSVLQRHRDTMHTKHEAARAAREAFHQGMDNPSLSASDLEALGRKDAEAHRAEFSEAHAVLQEAAKVLTPEQLAQYQKLRSTLPRPGQGMGPQQPPMGGPHAEGPGGGRGPGGQSGREQGRESDHGRPVEKIAQELGVTPDQFRAAFAKVTPAHRGERPTESQRDANRTILSQSLGVSPERLDEVMDKYRPEGRQR
jgi:Spy/CpxP family protein refolding chaperone